MSVAYVSFEDQVRIPSDAFDLSGFRRWVHSDEYPERGKISFIDGEIVVDMSPEEISSHAMLKSDLHAQLWMFVRTHKLGVCYPDGVLLINEAAMISNEPDIMFCSTDSLKTRRVQPREFELNSGRYVELAGSPDLVVELVSRSSVRKDTRLLRDAYFAAGIDEYWLIDARGDRVEFQLLTRGENGYVPAPADSDGYQPSAVLRASFRITREWNDVTGAEYTLHDRCPQS